MLLILQTNSWSGRQVRTIFMLCFSFDHCISWNAILLLLGKTPYDVFPVCHRVRRPSSFVTKWASRISRERFDVESPNFTWTFTPVSFTTAPDMTPLTTSGWQLSKLKIGRKCCLWRLHCRISREPFEIKSPNFTGTSILTCSTFAPDMTSLPTSGRMLQRKKPSKMPPQTASGGISWERFKQWSPSFTPL